MPHVPGQPGLNYIARLNFVLNSGVRGLDLSVGVAERTQADKNTPALFTDGVEFTPSLR